PQIEINTIDARAILPQNINLRQAVKQWGGLAGFIASLYRRDFSKVGHYLQDFVIEPVRKGLIPGFSDVKQAALDAGAIACSISGSGPTLFALTLDPDNATGIANAMQEAFRRVDLRSTTYISKINREGTQVIINETV
ncbi:MAG TPA: homoserine kinase, partial [Planctomycetaceae bacterium]|nr:homoserine kinase [Planctomycetaceae bacterium]